MRPKPLIPILIFDMKGLLPDVQFTRSGYKLITRRQAIGAFIARDRTPDGGAFTARGKANSHAENAER